VLIDVGWIANADSLFPVARVSLITLQNHSSI